MKRVMILLLLGSALVATGDCASAEIAPATAAGQTALPNGTVSSTEALAPLACPASTRRDEFWAGGLWAVQARQQMSMGQLDKARQVLLTRLKRNDEPNDWTDKTMINNMLKDIYLTEKGAIRADCGASALHRILGARGITSSEKLLDKVLRQPTGGTSVTDLIGVAAKYGVWGEGVVLTPDLALDIRDAWIAYLDTGHFVLVTAVSEDTLVVMDSAGLSRPYSTEAFSERWSGSAVVFDRTFVARHPETRLNGPQMAQMIGGCDGGGCDPAVASGDNKDSPDALGQANQPQGKPACPVWTVNMSRLNLALNDTDIIYRTIGPPLRVARTYLADSTQNDVFGRKWVWTYGTKVSAGAGNTVYVTYPTGRIVGFDWTGAVYVPNDGSQDELSKNGDNSFNLYSKTSNLTYSYQPLVVGGKLSSISDRNGNTLTVSWLSNKIEITDAVGRKTICMLTGGRISSVVDPAGRTASLKYSAAGDLVSSTDPAGVTSQYTYDADGYVTSTNVPTRGMTTFTYTSDTRGKWLSQITNPDGTTRRYYLAPTVQCWDERGKLSYYTNEKFNNQVWRNLNFTDNLGRAYAYTYANPSVPSLPTQVQDPRGAVTQFDYDPRGNLTSSIDPLGNRTSITYDAEDNPLTITDALGRRNEFAYDDPIRGDLIRVTNAIGQPTQFAYDVRGLLTSTTDAKGNTTTYSYDPLGNLAAVTDAMGNSSYYQSDVIGNLISATDALGNVSSYEHDLMGRAVSITQPGGGRVSFQYGVSDLLAVTDQNGSTTHFEYDHYGKLKRSIDANGGVTSMAYDPSGNMTSISDALGHATTYTYDDNNRLTLVQYPDGTTEGYAYDNGGLLISKRDGNSVTTAYTYDLAGRPTAVSAPGLSIRYYYDATGNLLGVRDGLGLTRFGYNELNRVTQVTNPFRQRIVYGYDEVGNRAWMQTPDGLTTYAYDALSRQVAVSCPWNTTYFEFDANGNRTGMYDSVRRAIYTHDSRSRITSMRNVRAATGEMITSYQYSYDAVGNPRSIIENDGSRTFYGYDLLNRLVSETRNGGPAPYSYRYTYDAAGNRLAKTNVTAGQTTNYIYDAANKMLIAGTASFSYDGNGNLVARSDTSGTARYYWDARNKLIRAATPGAGTVQYSYDGFGQRLRRVGPSGTATYLYDPQAAIPAVLAATSGVASSRYALSVGGSPIGETQGANSRAYVYDGSGSASSTLDSGGAMESRGYCDAWGNGVGPGGLAPRGYEGEFGYWSDPDSALLLVGARWYDGSSGRFLSRDPAGYGADLNLYAYCSGRPTTLVDPTGRYALIDDAIAGAAGAVIGVGSTLITDVVTGEWSPAEKYVGSAVGGAVGGVAVLYTGGLASGALGGAAGNATEQWIAMGRHKQDCFDYSYFAYDVGSSALIGAIIPARNTPGVKPSTLQTAIKGAHGQDRLIHDVASDVTKRELERVFEPMPAY